MVDISLCEGKDCPLKNKCYRFMSPRINHANSWLFGIPYDPINRECDFFWPIDKRHKIKDKKE